MFPEILSVLAADFAKSDQHVYVRWFGDVRVEFTRRPKTDEEQLSYETADTYTFAGAVYAD